MNVDARAEAWAALQLSGIAPRPLVELLRAFGSPEAVLAASAGAAPRTRCTEPATPRALGSRAGSRAARAHARLARASPAPRSSRWDDADYPRALLEIGDPPPVFYCLGRRELLDAAGARDRRQPQRDAAGLRRRRGLRRRAVRAPGSPSSAGWRSASTPPRIAARSSTRAAASPWSAPGSTASTRRAIATSRTRSPRAAR